MAEQVAIVGPTGDEHVVTRKAYESLYRRYGYTLAGDKAIKIRTKQATDE